MRVGGLAVGFRCAVERCVVLDECSVQQYGQVVVVGTYSILYSNYSPHALAYNPLGVALASDACG